MEFYLFFYIVMKCEKEMNLQEKKKIRLQYLNSILLCWYKTFHVRYVLSSIKIYLSYARWDNQNRVSIIKNWYDLAIIQVAIVIYYANYIKKITSHVILYIMYNSTMWPILVKWIFHQLKITLIFIFIE